MLTVHKCAQMNGLKMTTKDNALRMAIEALEYHTEQTRPIQKTIDALAVCKAALSDAVTLPDGWVSVRKDVFQKLKDSINGDCGNCGNKFYSPA